MARLTLARPPA